ncbi:MAG TPA: Bax inhibitor-1 family protein [Solirubrobacteraceae bacterium]|jgi:modulator of FtsH protease
MSYDTAYSGAEAQARSVPQILGQVMFLVAVAIGFMAVGTLIGRDLSESTARVCSFTGLGMLIASSFVDRLRYGPVGIGWLCALALLIGLGLGPVIAYMSETQPGDVSTAVGLTALVVLGMASVGYAIDKDTVGWMKPLSFIVLGAVVISIGALVFGGLGTLSPVLSVVILIASSLLILVDFNYIRKHATAHDVVWLATGIFVSIVNIFISLLNLIGR